jgi:hypothetical protein
LEHREAAVQLRVVDAGEGVFGHFNGLSEDRPGWGNRHRPRGWDGADLSLAAGGGVAGRELPGVREAGKVSGSADLDNHVFRPDIDLCAVCQAAASGTLGKMNTRSLAEVRLIGTWELEGSAEDHGNCRRQIGFEAEWGEAFRDRQQNRSRPDG